MFSITNYYRNANQNYSEVSSHTSQNGYHQEVYKWSADKGLKKKDPSYTVDGIIN